MGPSDLTTFCKLQAKPTLSQKLMWDRSNWIAWKSHVTFPITLMWLCWQTSASSKPVTLPVTPLALVPPWNSSALEAPLSQLHTDSRDSRNLVPHSNSGITNTGPQYYHLKFSPKSSSCSYSGSCSCPMFWHSIPCVSLPVHTAFLCSNLYSICSCS